MLRLAARLGKVSEPLSFILGRGGSTSRTMRSISSRAPRLKSWASSGGEPTSSSYSITPRAYTSVRVSMSIEVGSACSGLMYVGVPTMTPMSAKLISVSFCSVALATPKSITLGVGRPSTSVTRTLAGFKSRWIIPFW